MFARVVYADSVGLLFHCIRFAAVILVLRTLSIHLAVIYRNTQEITSKLFGSFVWLETRLES